MMNKKDVTLNRQQAEIFVPDGTPLPEALERTTHMAVAAHPDDIEIMAYDGILKCFQKGDQWFLGVVVTDGAGSPRDKFYADYTDEEMVLTRSLEQKKAAMLGEYAAVALLFYPSAEVKDTGETGPVNDLIELLQHAKPSVVYTHTLTDRHDTHVAVALRTIKAIRSLPAENRPQKVLGCEVWRDLDWLIDEDKVVFDVSDHPNLASALLGVFDTQNSGAKRIDQATLGRRASNATYHASHVPDETSALIYATDLTRLIDESDFRTEDHVKALLDHFSNDVMERLKRVG
jgi:LmbE family N-acetylglucosaminyl deacetylase